MKLNFSSGDTGLYLGIAPAKRSCDPNERDPNAFRTYRPQHAVEPKMLEVPEGFRSKQPRVVRYSQQPHMGVRP